MWFGDVVGRVEGMVLKSSDVLKVCRQETCSVEWKGVGDVWFVEISNGSREGA